MNPDVAAFEAAWNEFGEACSGTVAPEATYQAWLAHFTIKKMDLLRVVREVDFGARYLGPEAAAHFPGNNLMVDLLVLREPPGSPTPFPNLPRRSWLGPKGPIDEQPNPRSGLERLSTFAIITELKVSASQGGGLTQHEVLRDFHKLLAILTMAKKHYPDEQLPAAFVCVLDNHGEKRFNFDQLRDRVSEAGIRADVHLLAYRPRHLDRSGIAN